MTRVTTIGATAALLGLAAMLGGASGQIREEPPLVIESTYGADLYQFYCATCHGATGQGATLRSSRMAPPPDLTRLTRQHGGVYPRDRVRDTITFGSKAPAAPAHGTADMPVWGTIFRGLEPSDTHVAIRIENLVRFIETLQDQSAGEQH